MRLYRDLSAGWAGFLFILLVQFGVLAPGPPPAAANTYMRVSPSPNIDAYTSVTGSGNVLASDDQYAKMAAITNQIDGYNYIGVQFFSVTFREDTHGYLSDIQSGIEYHIWPNPFTVHTPRDFTQDDWIDGWYGTWNVPNSPNANYYKLRTDWFPYADKPPTDASVVSATELDGTKDTVYVKSFRYDSDSAKSMDGSTLGSDWANMSKWNELNGSIGGRSETGSTGAWSLYNEFDWYGRPLVSTKMQCDTGTWVYIDQIFINCLVKLTFTATSRAPASKTQGTLDVPMLWVKCQTFSNSNFAIKDLKVDFTGTCVVADFAALKLYRDNNENGLIDAADTLTKSVPVTTTTGAVFNPAGNLINTVAHNSLWILAVDLTDDAMVDHTVGMKLANEGYVTTGYARDEVASNADRAHIHTLDSVNPNPLWPVQTAAGATTIKKIATLTSSFTAPTAGLSKAVGTSFSVTVNVANAANGGDAINVLPSTPVPNVAGAAVTSTTPPAQSIAAGGNASFTWTFIAAQAVAANGLTFSSTATGTDQVSGRAVVPAGATSPGMTITGAVAPSLKLTLTAAPTPVSVGNEAVTVTASVKNWGTGPASAVKVYNTGNTPYKLTASSGDGATVDDPTGTPAGPQDIGVGETKTWVFTYATTHNGTVKWAGYAKGSSGAQSDATSNTCTILGIANVTNTSLAATPANPGKSSAFTATYTVTNSGSATALMVTPTELTLNTVVAGDLPPIMNWGPVPPTAEIAVGGTATFLWSWNSRNATTLGTYNLTASVDFTDINTGQVKNAGIVTSPDFNILNAITPLTNAAVSGAVRKLITYSDDDNYYVISGLAAANFLYKFNPGGVLVWTVDLSGAPNNITVPGDSFVVSTETVYGTSYNVIWIGATNGRVYAIKDLGSSAEGWWGVTIANSYKTLSNVADVTPGLVVYDGMIFAPAGKFLCKRTTLDGVTPPGWVDYSGAAGNITTTPSMDNNYIYFGSADKRLYCINQTNGSLQTKTATLAASVTGSPFLASITTSTYRIFTTAGGTLYRINSMNNFAAGNVSALALTGTLSDVWACLANDSLFVTDLATKLYKINVNPTPMTIAATVTRANEALYGPIEYNDVVYLNSAGTAAAPANWGKVYAINKANPATNVNGLWPYQTLSGQQFRSPVAIDPWNNVFLSGNEAGRVFIFGLPTP